MQSTSSQRSTLLLLPLLLLLTQLLAAVPGGAAVVAAEAPVHGVSVQSVRSSRSILYHGMQVPLFENTNANASGAVRGPGRYFFQPLALLDCSSTRLVDTRSDAAAAEDDADDGVRNATGVAPTKRSPRRKLVLLTVLLWTDDFLAAARAQLSSGGAAVSVELMPLTELTLTWSSQAGHWLGAGFERRFRLLGGWRDAQKPRAQATFTVACDLPADCRRLPALLEDADGSAGHLFDLRYRVRCDSKRLLSVQLASRHLQRSPLFSRLRAFAARSAGVALASEAIVGQLATELLRAALDEFQELAGEQDRPAAAAFSVDPAALAALTADAERLLRGTPVTSVGASQWAERVFWQPLTVGSGVGSNGLRPDRLASLLNRLMTSGGPGAVRPTTEASTLLDALAGEGDLPLAALTAIRRFLGFGGGGDGSSGRAAEIDVADVRELATSLGSSVAWDPAGARFVPPPSLLLYQLDTARLLQAGVFAVRDATLRFRVSEQRDHVTPLCRAVHGSADYTTASRGAQADLLSLRLRPLLLRADKAAAELQRLQTALVTAKAASPGSEVSHRSSDGEWAELPPVPDATELADLRGSIDTLTSRVRALTSKPPWQRRFAGSFCVLANSGPPPPGMSCRTMAFVVPKAFLKSGRLSSQTIRVGTGMAGQNLLQPLKGGKFYRLQLSGCCK